MSDFTSQSENSEAQTQLSSGLSSLESFSQQLTQARVLAGFSLEAAAQATRISEPFIRAMEEGDLKSLPGKVFARGFIRSLSKSYSTPSEPLLSAMEEAYKALEPSPATEKGSKKTPKLDSGREAIRIARSSKLGRLPRWNFRLPLATQKWGALGGLILITALGLGAIYRWSSWGSPAKPADQLISDLPSYKDTDGPELQNPPSEAEYSADQWSEPEKLAISSGKNPAEPASPPRTMGLIIELSPALRVPLAEAQTLNIKTKKAQTLSISRDGAPEAKVELKVDILYTLAFSSQLRLRAPDPASLTGSYNGKDLGLLSDKSRELQFTFRAQAKNLSLRKSLPQNPGLRTE